MWDYNVGLVRMTPFFKCCKYSKVSGTRTRRDSIELTLTDNTGQDAEYEPRAEGDHPQYHWWLHHGSGWAILLSGPFRFVLTR